MKFTDLKWVALSMVLLAACSDDKKDNGGENPEGPQGSGTMEVLDSEESKTFLQNAATDFLNKFQPEDQKELIELAAYYSEEYGGLEAPAEFDIEADGKERIPDGFMRGLKAAGKGDMEGLTRAASSYSYTIKFDNFTGVYEPNKSRHAWVKTGESNDIVFKFTNENAQIVEMKIAQSGGVYDLDYSLSEWEEDYNSNTGRWEEYEVKYNYFLSIPKKVIITLTEAGRQLANSTIESTIDIKGHSMYANIDATAMNLRATSKLNGNDSQISLSGEFYVSGEKVGSAYATINGSKLCDQDAWEALDDLNNEKYRDELARMIKTGECGADMLGKVQVYGQLNYYRDMADDMNACYDDYEYDSREEARNECQKACNRLNKNIKTQLRYNNTKTDQATLRFEPELDSYYGGSYWEYYVTCNIVFPDETSYSLDSYFSKFTIVSNKWETLINAYEKVWNTALGRK